VFVETFEIITYISRKNGTGSAGRQLSSNLFQYAELILISRSNDCTDDVTHIDDSSAAQIIVKIARHANRPLIRDEHLPKPALLACRCGENICQRLF